jgi:hypothetical protein
MIDYPTANQIVRDYLIRMFPVEFPEIVIREEWTKEKNYGWVIRFWNPKWSEQIRYGGCGPLIVMKEDGMLHDLGEMYIANVRRMEALILAFEALKLDPRFWKDEDRNTYREMQLALASAEGDLSTVRRLWEQGVSVDAVDPIGRTALMLAIQFEEFAVIRFLLSHGADVNVPSSNGITALVLAIWAMWERQDTLVKLLLKAGASVHMRCDEDWTVLHFAAYSSHTSFSIFRRLVLSGADVNAVNAEGQTPLMLAVQHGTTYKGTGRARYLLWKRADVSVQDNKGWTVLDHALEYDGPVELLIRAGAIRGKRGA